jgi:hypothetical protein
MMGYAIICDARTGDKFGISKLALVDRKLSKRYWWTSDTAALILNFLNLSAAEYCVRRLKKNNARIIDYEQAKIMIAQQNDAATNAQIEFDHLAALYDAEMGWDAHKSAF